MFVCRYGFAIYLLRDRDVTYGELRRKDDLSPFQTFITKSEEFRFGRDDIVRIRGEIALLLDRLSALYKEWKISNDEAEKKAQVESKKPATRRLLLEDGDGPAVSERAQAASVPLQDEDSTPSPSLQWKAKDDIQVDEEGQAASKAEQQKISKPSPSLQTKVMDVEMAEEGGGTMLAEQEETGEPSLLSRAKLDAEMADADDAMLDVEDETSEKMNLATPVKIEEDQFPVDEFSVTDI